MRSLRTLSLIVVTLLLAAAAFAEDKKPLSPPAKAKGKIGSAKVMVDYSAPSMRGRKIMGELVPYGKVWRTGANAATSLETSGDLMIGDLHVPAGKYTLYTLPGEKEWMLIVSKQTGQWGSNYDPSHDLGRVKMKVEKTDEAVETMVFSIDEKGALVLHWENTRVSVPLLAH